NDDAVAIAIKGARGLGRVLVGCERALRFEAGEDAEGVNAFTDPAADGEVDFTEPQHLRGVNQAEITGGAGGADGVGGTGDAEIERNLSGRVVGHSARVVVVRPILRVVIELRNGVDFVLGLDVAVFGGAD